MNTLNTSIIVLVFAFISSVSFAQTNTTMVFHKSLPQSDTINISNLLDKVEIIETLEEFSSIEFEVNVNANEGITNRLANLGAFAVNYSHPTKNDLTVVAKHNEFFVTVKGQDLEIKRNYKLYVPRGTIVIN
jgi:hypothetical protein